MPTCFYLAAFSSEDVFTQRDLQLDFGKGGFTNFYVRSQLKFMKVQSPVSECLIPFRMYEVNRIAQG